jgi:hypothetical protein
VFIADDIIVGFGHDCLLSVAMQLPNVIRGLRLMADRLAEFAERNISEHALAVIVQNPQIIRLRQECRAHINKYFRPVP